MELVKSVKDILENAKRFDKYIECGKPDERVCDKLYCMGKMFCCRKKEQ